MFKNPPKSSGPLVRWWWPGMDVEKDELLKEIAELDEKGFYGAEIQSFCLGLPLEMRSSDQKRFERCHRFLQPYYYEMVKAVMDECAKRDMIIDLTICSSWPAGGVHVDKNDAMQVMLPGTIIVEGDMHYSGEVPGFIKPYFYDYEKEYFPKLFGLDESTLEFLPEEMKLIRVAAAKVTVNGGEYSVERSETVILDSKTVVDLTDRVRDKYIEWDVPSGKWQLFSFYTGPSGSSPLGDARECAYKKSIVIDHLSCEPVRRYLEYHFGRGKAYFGEHFGKTFRAFFTDSLELANESFWTHDFLKKFKQWRGYELAPYLPVIYVPNKDNSYRTNKPGPAIPCFDFEDDIGERIRYDVQQTISDLFVEEFAGTMADWAVENGLESRIQSYGIRADSLKVYGISHIPETETLYAGGVIDFLKLAGSAGVIYDKKIISAESMSWNNRDFMTTLQKIKVTADRLFVSGINQMIFHGFSYQDKVFSYPGYRPFSNIILDKSLNFSSYFGRTIPHWEYIQKLTMYIARCQYILQQGRTVSNIGIFYPMFNYSDLTPKYEEMVRGYLDENDAPLPKDVKLFDSLDGETMVDSESLDYLIKQTALGDNLMANGYYYVHVNEDRILNSIVRNGRIIIGSAELEVLVIAHTEKISIDLARKLEEISINGGRVLFVGKIPDKQPGFRNFRENEKELSKIVSEMISQSSFIVAEENNIATHIMKKLEVMPDLLYDEELSSIHYIHKKTDESDYYFIRYNKNYPDKITVKFALNQLEQKVPYVLDPWTGISEEAAQYKVSGNRIEMDIYFEAYGSIIIEFKPGKSLEHLNRCSQRVIKERDLFISFFENKGRFDFEFYNLGIKTIEIDQDVPKKMTVDIWHLESEFRDVKGSISIIALDIKGLKGWCEIPELQYNSGKGIYSTEVNIDKVYMQEHLSVFLELGHVHDIAVVKINGHELEPLIVYPYNADITGALAEGVNIIEVSVVTTLRNRLVGYAETGDPEYANYKDRELMPCGLIGPVNIVPKWKYKI